MCIVSTHTSLREESVCRPVARIFRRGAMWVSLTCEYACISMEDYGGLGACSPRKILEIRCSEIVSEAILGQKQSRSSYKAREVLHPIFGCPRMHLLSQLTSNFQERRY